MTAFNQTKHTGPSMHWWVMMMLSCKEIGKDSYFQIVSDVSQITIVHINGLVQDCSISNALTMELQQACANLKASIYAMPRNRTSLPKCCKCNVEVILSHLQKYIWIPILFALHFPPFKQIDGLVHERRNSIANALELRLSCTNPKWQWVSTDPVKSEFGTSLHGPITTGKFNLESRYCLQKYVLFFL